MATSGGNESAELSDSHSESGSGSVNMVVSKPDESGDGSEEMFNDEQEAEETQQLPKTSSSGSGHKHDKHDNSEKCNKRRSKKSVPKGKLKLPKQGSSKDSKKQKHLDEILALDAAKLSEEGFLVYKVTKEHKFMIELEAEKKKQAVWKHMEKEMHNLEKELEARHKHELELLDSDKH